MLLRGAAPCRVGVEMERIRRMRPYYAHRERQPKSGPSVFCVAKCAVYYHIFNACVPDCAGAYVDGSGSRGTTMTTVAAESRYDIILYTQYKYVCAYFDGAKHEKPLSHIPLTFPRQSSAATQQSISRMLQYTIYAQQYIRNFYTYVTRSNMYV